GQPPTARSERTAWIVRSTRISLRQCALSYIMRPGPSTPLLEENVLFGVIALSQGRSDAIAAPPPMSQRRPPWSIHVASGFGVLGELHSRSNGMGSNVVYGFASYVNAAVMSTIQMMLR